MYKLLRLGVLLPIVGLLALGNFAAASHSWGNYHWARTANPFTLKLGDNVGSAWDKYLRAASVDWSVSSVLDTKVVSGTTNGRTCRPKAGRVEVCNSKYGKNGWLGLASIWVSGNHITQGAVKLNNSYFNSNPYNTSAWRQSVMCQEIGHTFGLDHQDEDFGNPNLGTCMDYTSDPSTNQKPNQHDYDQLEAIYAHLDSTTTVAAGSVSSGAEVGEDPASWGKAIKHSKNGKSSLHEKDLGHGNKILTFVIWEK